ncbi:MAG: bifunctional folylpolyglutamate synthase/dihydrofolate synthase [Elusimicrobiota bacterium]
MNYSDAERALEKRRETVIRLGLSRMRRVLTILGNPDEAFPSLHVAGTNGKGSICAILSRALREAGRGVGLYISPHLWSVRERVQIDGDMISPQAFGRLTAQVLAAEERGRTKLTYFELVTCVAFLYFRERAIRVAVLETGLGGRLDATNAVRNPAVCVISSLSYDHTDFLGSTIPEIAREKAGIIKKGRPVVCPRLASAAMAEIRRKARSVGAPLTVVDRPWSVVSTRWRQNRQVLKDPGNRRFVLGLLGSRQGANVALARAALNLAPESLRVPDASWRRALSSVRWPLRFEVRPIGKKVVILDGAHNPEAARNLSETWAHSPWAGKPSLWILGMMRDKDACGVVAALRNHMRDVILTRPPGPRSMELEFLARSVRQAAPRARIRLASSVAEALAVWRSEKVPGTAIVCGSFYLASAAARALGFSPG